MSKNRPLCPIAQTATILGSRWTAQIVSEFLAHGPRRFQDLADTLAGISPNTLSARLKMLEASGIIVRTVHDTYPPRTDYSLTPQGRRLGGVIEAMRRWGRGYAP